MENSKNKSADKDTMAKQKEKANNYTFIDLFAGAGGLSEGFVQAGFQPLAHVEMNEYAAKTLETRTAYYYFKEKRRLGIYDGYLCCVGTSATMGSGESRDSIIQYATDIFGEPFEQDSVITEDRLSADEYFAGRRKEFNLPLSMKGTEFQQKVWAALQEIHHGFLSVGVAGGGDIALGLVHHYINLFLTLEALPVEADVVGEDVHLGAKFRHNLSVHGDNAALDHCIGLPAGANAGIGDEFVEAHHFLDFSGRAVVVGVTAVYLGLTAEHCVHTFLGAVPLLVGLAISGAAAGTSGF